MKKQTILLGSLALAGAISMSVFAGNPASARDLVPLDKSENRTSADVTVKVRVVGEAPTVNITKPSDNQVVMGKATNVSVDYTNANELKYELIYVASNGTKTSYDLPTVTTAASGVANGTNAFNLDITNYGGKYGDYILKATASGSGSVVDSVSFKFISFDFEVKGKDGETGDPIIKLKKNPLVRRTLIQVYDPEGNPLFDDPIEVDLNEDEDVDVTLPISKFGTPEGQYRIVATPYDEDGNIIDANVIRTIDYTPAPAPDVPETGSILGSLGLSRSDLISTGLALLFVAGFFGILIIAKRNKKSRR